MQAPPRNHRRHPRRRRNRRRRRAEKSPPLRSQSPSGKQRCSSTPPARPPPRVKSAALRAAQATAAAAMASRAGGGTRRHQPRGHPADPSRGEISQSSWCLQRGPGLHDPLWVPRSFRSHMPWARYGASERPNHEPSRKSARRSGRNRISSKVTLHPSPVGDWPSKPILSRDVSSSRTNTRIICQAAPSGEAW